MLWSNLLDVLRGSLFVLAHWCGGSFGAAILIASAASRLALMPLTLAATRRRLVRERKMRELAPALAELKRQYSDKPEALFAAMQTLHEAHGVPMFDRRGVLDSLISLPPAAALYSAVRGVAGRVGGFLWVADLAKPDRLLAALAGVIAGVIAGGMAWTSVPPASARGAAQLVPVLVTTVVTYMILYHLSAGIALYSVANSIINAVEQVIAARTLESSVA